MSAGASQGEIQHHNLIGGNERGDRHDEDQVPGEGRAEYLCWTPTEPTGLTNSQKKAHSDSLADERDRKRGLRDLLSNEKEEDSLSQQHRDGHSQLLSPSCEGDNRNSGDRKQHNAQEP